MIDPKRVEDLAALGMSDAQIADYLPCDPKTLRSRFSAELAAGRARLTGGLKVLLHDLAVSQEHVPAMIWAILIRSGQPPWPHRRSRKVRPATDEPEPREPEPVVAPAEAAAAEPPPAAKPKGKPQPGPWVIREFAT